LVIEGDNYDALRNLVSTHAGEASLIYIDPPYNTGSKDFIYNDHYFDSTNRFRHSTWLEFMYQRLRLAKDLLKDSGAIIVSIDDNELFPLGMLMNKVFGESAFVANCIWQKRYSRENREAIGDAHEYLLIYALNPELFKKRRGALPLGEKQRALYKNPDNDPKGLWQSVSLTAQGYRPNQMYAIEGPHGSEHRPPEGTCWKVIKSEYERIKADNRIYFGKDGKGVPRRKYYLSEAEGLVPWTWWPHEEVGHTDEARKEIQDIFGTQTAFDTPKPVRLLERVLKIAAPEKDALVIDFFAGSGTTGHVVLKMNQADGGNRRFILVSSTEATTDQPNKNICKDVCATRLRRVIEGYTSSKTGAVAGIPGSFAYLRTKHVPTHRLEEQLTDGMAWSFIQMRHGHAITEVTKPLALSTNGTTAVVYLSSTKAANLNALQDAMVQHPNLLVYTWTPSVLEKLVPENNLRAIPAALVRTFRFGHLPPQEQK